MRSSNMPFHTLVHGQALNEADKPLIVEDEAAISGVGFDLYILRLLIDATIGDNTYYVPNSSTHPRCYPVPRADS